MSSAPDIDTFVKGCQFQTIAAPPSLSHHLDKSLLQSLATSGFLAAVGKPWSLDAIRATIKRGPHTSTCNSASTTFCLKELADRVSQGFSLLLTAETAILLFGRRLRISRLASVPQANKKDRLICDSTASPPSGDSLLPTSSEDTPAVNVSTDRSVAPQAMHFGPCFPRILQKISEAYPQDGPVYLSKWDIIDTFHRCVLRPADVGAFSYLVSPLPSNTAIYLCVDLVLPMFWLRSPPFFCAASETAADLANTYLADHRSPTPEYGPTLGTYSTVPSPPASAGQLQATDVYMDDHNCLAQGISYQ